MVNPQLSAGLRIYAGLIGARNPLSLPRHVTPKPAHGSIRSPGFYGLLWPANNSVPRSVSRWCVHNCRRIGESTRSLNGAGSGVSNESRFPGKCFGCDHVDHGYRCPALGDQDLLRRVNWQDAGVEQEASGQEEVRDLASLPRRRKPAIQTAPLLHTAKAVSLTASRSLGSAPRGQSNPACPRAVTSQDRHRPGRSRIRRRVESIPRPAGAQSSR